MRSILALEDLEAPARRILPRAIFSFVAFGVETGASLRANRESFEELCFLPRVLIDVARRTTATTILGRSYAVPFGVAPMGGAGLACHRGDLALASAAREAGAPFILSGASTIPLERIVRENPAAWFQAYLPPDRDAISALVDRVAAAGFETLVATVDVPVPSNREQLDRAGYTTPLRPTVRLAWDALRHPRWLAGCALRTLATDGMPHLENMSARRGPPLVHSRAVRSHVRDRLTWREIEGIRARWTGKLVVKGLLAAEDARIARESGVDGVIVSNHGGRQLDGAAAPLRVLPEIAAAAPGVAILCDGGFRRGTDVLKALALGAQGVFIGRPFMYALAIAGEAGARRVCEILAEEIGRDLALLGCTDYAELPSRVRRCGGAGRKE